jgi:hypothetical protein
MKLGFPLFSGICSEIDLDIMRLLTAVIGQIFKTADIG